MSRRFRELVHPTNCLCGGEGWLWGHELLRPNAGTVADHSTRYPCDHEWPDEDLPPAPEPEPRIARGDS